MSSSSEKTDRVSDILKKFKWRRPKANPVFDKIVAAESGGCGAYEKAVRENKFTYLWVDSSDDFDVSQGYFNAFENWKEELLDECLATFALELASAFHGDWVCVTFRRPELYKGDKTTECMSMFIDNNGKGVLKYSKLVDKDGADFSQGDMKE